LRACEHWLSSLVHIQFDRRDPLDSREIIPRSQLCQDSLTLEFNRFELALQPLNLAAQPYQGLRLLYPDHRQYKGRNDDYQNESRDWNSGR